MGWFWGSKPTESEAVRNLDPSLRKFLEEQKPPEQPAARTRESQTNLDILKASQSPLTSTRTQDAPLVPQESLYQDGRYAELWKNYKPLHQIEASTKTDQQRMTDLVDSITERKFQLKEAAIENCSLESLAIQDCYNSNNSWSMLTLCRKENRAFDRCFEMQAKFLKALGFMATVGDPESGEKVQMHADGLYRQMLDQEQRVKEAKEAGAPIPHFAPVMSKQNIARAMGFSGLSQQEENVLNKVKPEIRKQFEERLKDLKPEDRELEMRIIESEVAAEQQKMETLGSILQDERAERTRRIREGKATIGDRAKGLWGWATDDPK